MSKVTVKIVGKIRHIKESFDEGTTIRFVKTRMGYIWDSLS